MAIRFCKTCNRICDDAYCPVCNDGPFYYVNTIQLLPNYVCCEQTQSTDYCCVCGEYQNSIADAEPIALDHSKAKKIWRKDVVELEELMDRRLAGFAQDAGKVKDLSKRRYCKECKVLWDSDAKRCQACASNDYVILQQEFDCYYHCGTEWPQVKHCGSCGIKLY